jgi:sugar/nucleoside kinase (ribokinase family)
MYDIITIGDSSLDVFLKISEASVQCSLNQDDCLLQLNYADKIPVETITRTVGGNACNVAIGSSKMGLKTGYFGILGDDEIGQLILSKLKKYNITTNCVTLAKGEQSNYTTALNYKGERTLLVYHAPRKYFFPEKLPETKWVYFTSLNKGFEKHHQKLIHYIEKKKIPMAFNPGTYQIKLPFSKIEPILRHTHILFVNVTEAKRILRKDIRDIKRLLCEFSSFGISYICITDGPKGAYAYDSKKKEFYNIPPYPGKRIEATGAGDSFATGVVAGMFYEKDFKKALLWGPVNSASVVQKIGPQAGLLTLSEMKNRLKHKPSGYKLISL